jgi:hypothetical protein
MKETRYSSETVLPTKTEKVKRQEGDKKLRKSRLDGAYRGKLLT